MLNNKILENKRILFLSCVCLMIVFLSGCIPFEWMVSIDGKNDLYNYAKNKFGDCTVVSYSKRDNGEKINKLTVQDNVSGVEYNVWSGVEEDWSGLDLSFNGYRAYVESDFNERYTEYIAAQVNELLEKYDILMIDDMSYFRSDEYTYHKSYLCMKSKLYTLHTTLWTEEQFDEIAKEIDKYDIKNMYSGEYKAIQFLGKPTEYNRYFDYNDYGIYGSKIIDFNVD